jgi:hypothetical protein
VARGGDAEEPPERDTHGFLPHLLARSTGRSDEGRLTVAIRARTGLQLPLFVSAVILGWGAGIRTGST